MHMPSKSRQALAKTFDLPLYRMRGPNLGHHAVGPKKGTTRNTMPSDGIVDCVASVPSNPTKDAAMTDWNTAIIEEFRQNGGLVGGTFEGAPLLLLHSTGARSGLERVNPMMYQALGDSYAVFASKMGAPTHPSWYHNLVVNPEASVEVGTEHIAVRARVLDAVEREPIWTKQKTDYPAFAGYEQKTDRIIPVVMLDPA